MDLPHLPLFDQLSEDPAARATELFEMGFDTVVIPIDRELARISKSAGLIVWIYTTGGSGRDLAPVAARAGHEAFS